MANKWKGIAKNKFYHNNWLEKESIQYEECTHGLINNIETKA